MQGARSDLGPRGERAALAEYRRRGYRLVSKNWRCPLGELDLVLAKRGLLVFCEVKTRTGADLGGPYEAVTWQKQARLRRLAEAFLAANPTRAEQRFRFDVASVTVSRRGQQQVYFFEDAF